MLSRRQFISRSGAAGAALVFAPQTRARGAEPRNVACCADGRFAQGVLSGDPTPRGITLLTVLDDVTGSGSVRLEVGARPRLPARRGAQDDRPEPAAAATRSRHACRGVWPARGDHVRRAPRAAPSTVFGPTAPAGIGVERRGSASQPGSPSMSRPASSSSRGLYIDASVWWRHDDELPRLRARFARRSHGTADRRRCHSARRPGTVSSEMRRCRGGREPVVPRGAPRGADASRSSLSRAPTSCALLGLGEIRRSGSAPRRGRWRPAGDEAGTPKAADSSSSDAPGTGSGRTPCSGTPSGSRWRSRGTGRCWPARCPASAVVVPRAMYHGTSRPAAANGACSRSIRPA